MSNEAYKVLKDTSLPRALFEVGETANGDKLYETEGRSYAEGDYVLAEDITPPLRERIENGELSHLVVEVDRDEALAALNEGEFGEFIPEHEVERQALQAAGHRVVSPEDAIKLGSVGAESAAAAQADALATGEDARPNIIGEGPEETFIPLDEAETKGLQTAAGVERSNVFVAKAKASSEPADEAKDEEGGDDEKSKPAPKPKPAKKAEKE